MGNRAIIALNSDADLPGEEHPNVDVVYLQWHGDAPSVLAFLQVAKTINSGKDALDALLTAVKYFLLEPELSERVKFKDAFPSTLYLINEDFSINKIFGVGDDRFPKCKDEFNQEELERYQWILAKTVNNSETSATSVMA